MGNIRDEVWAQIQGYTDVFHLKRSAVHVAVAVGESDVDVSVRFAEAMADLRKRDVLVALRGWRDELYPVTTGFAVPPHFTIERCTSLILGTRRYGVHLTCFVRKGERRRGHGERGCECTPCH